MLSNEVEFLLSNTELLLSNLLSNTVFLSILPSVTATPF